MNRFIKKFAKSNGLKIRHKIASGSLQGHTVTISEGKEFVNIHLSTYFADANKQQDFEESLNRKLLSRDLRVLELKLMPTGISATLSYRCPSDIASVEAFVNYFFPLLIQHGAVRSVNTLGTPTNEKDSSGKRYAFF